MYHLVKSCLIIPKVAQRVTMARTALACASVVTLSSAMEPQESVPAYPDILVQPVTPPAQMVSTETIVR